MLSLWIIKNYWYKESITFLESHPEWKASCWSEEACACNQIKIWWIYDISQILNKYYFPSSIFIKNISKGICPLYLKIMIMLWNWDKNRIATYVRTIIRLTSENFLQTRILKRFCTERFSRVFVLFVFFWNTETQKSTDRKQKLCWHSFVFVFSSLTIFIKQA